MRQFDRAQKESYEVDLLESRVGRRRAGSRRLPGMTTRELRSESTRISTRRSCSSSRKKALPRVARRLFEGKPEHHRLTHVRCAFLGDATTLEGGPGDVLYWPADHWHVGEGASGFAVSLSMAVTPGSGPPVEFFQRAWNEAGERLGSSGRKSGPAVRPSGLQASARGISRSVETARRSLEKAIGGGSLEDAVKSEWLERATSLGIENVPRPLPWRTLKDGDLLRGDPLYPVVSLLAGDDRMICSANGHCSRSPRIPGFGRCSRELNTGRALRVRDLLAKYSGTARTGKVEIEALPEGIRDVLEKLWSIRAVTIVPDEHPDE